MALVLIQEEMKEQVHIQKDLKEITSEDQAVLLISQLLVVKDQLSLLNVELSQALLKNLYQFPELK